MVKAYLRYEEAPPAGVIAAGQERCLVPGAAGGELLASGLEQVQRWGVRTGELLGALVAFSDEPLRQSLHAPIRFRRHAVPKDAVDFRFRVA